MVIFYSNTFIQEPDNIVFDFFLAEHEFVVEDKAIRRHFFLGFVYMILVRLVLPNEPNIRDQSRFVRSVRDQKTRCNVCYIGMQRVI